MTFINWRQSGEPLDKPPESLHNRRRGKTGGKPMVALVRTVA